MLAASFLQRPRRFAFEINDDDVILGDQHLRQMVVAVIANLDRFWIGLADSFQASQQGAAHLQHAFGQRLRRLRQRRSALCQAFEGGDGFAADPAQPVGQIVGANGFGVERRIACLLYTSRCV